MKEHHWEGFKLKGRVKLRRVSTFYTDDNGIITRANRNLLENQFNEHGMHIYAYSIDIYGIVTFKANFLYDANQNLIEKHHLKENGEISSKELFEYDNNNRLIASCFQNQFGTCSLKKRFEYQDNGKKMIETELNDSGKIISQKISVYDSNHRLIQFLEFDRNNQCDSILECVHKEGVDETIHYNGKREILNKKITTYDLNGNTLSFRESEYRYPQKESGWDYKHTYNQQNLLTTSICYGLDKSVQWRRTYIYDKTENVINESAYNPDLGNSINADQLSKVYETEYEYFE